MEPTKKLISILKNEVGYLEKKNNNDLYSKTGNAGSNNYTKYWAEIKPEYQGEPWCACLITWGFVQAFGKDNAKKLLKHYPYVYCPAMAELFELHAYPKVGDIVIFKRNGEFVHTGIVTFVDGDYFETIEGNTSGGSTIVANGGGVFKKSYYNSNLPGTKFCRPDYDLIKESEDTLMSKEYEELKTENDRQNRVIEAVGKDLNALAEVVCKTVVIYDYIDENIPEWAKPTIQKLSDKGFLKGDESGRLGLTEDLMRLLVINDRAGLYGR